MSKAIQKYTQETKDKAYLDTLKGANTIEIEANIEYPRLSQTNIAGMMLVKSCFESLTPKEFSFAAQMYAFKYDKPSVKQLKWLTTLLADHLALPITDLTPAQEELFTA